MKFSRLHLIFFVLLVSETSVAEGSTYYVSTSGSDSAAGTQAAPYKTLQKAANVVVAGDVVHVLAGTYTVGMNLYGKVGGSSLNPITFLADTGVILTHAATSGV